MAAFRRGDHVHLVRNHEQGPGDAVRRARPHLRPDRRPAARPTWCSTPTRAQLRRELRQPERHHPQLRRRPDAAGHLAQLRGDHASSQPAAPATATSSRCPPTAPSDAVPLKAMGRFSHEATATDPATGIVYETEDAGSSALYRFRPADPRNLAAGGVLEAMKLAGTADTRSWTTGTSPPPVAAVGRRSTTPTGRRRRRARGSRPAPRARPASAGARAPGTATGSIYVVSTDGGPARQGQVFAYDPVADRVHVRVRVAVGRRAQRPRQRLREPPRRARAVRGRQRRWSSCTASRPTATIFPFAQNNVVLPDSFAATKGYSGDFTGSEWAGATFEPKNGNWLFANIQSPGITFAITGPWKQGAAVASRQLTYGQWRQPDSQQ